MRNETFISLEQGDIFFRFADGNPDFPLLLVHGAGGNSSLFEKQLSGLENRNLTYAVDLPGHGRSNKADSPALNTYVNALDGLIRMLGLTNIVLAGHSMGGGILFELFKRIPEKIAGLIFISAGAVLPVNKMIFELIDTNFSGFCGLTAQFSLSESADDDIKTRVNEGLNIAGPATVKNDFSICDNFDYRDAAKNLDRPVLLLANEKDKMVSGKIIQEFHDSIPGSKLIKYPLKGHMPHWENSTQVNDDIISFISGLKPVEVFEEEDV